MNKTGISYLVDFTWNPCGLGCSNGCPTCRARRIAALHAKLPRYLALLQKERAEQAEQAERERDALHAKLPRYLDTGDAFVPGRDEAWWTIVDSIYCLVPVWINGLWDVRISRTHRGPYSTREAAERAMRGEKWIWMCLPYQWGMARPDGLITGRMDVVRADPYKERMTLAELKAAMVRGAEVKFSGGGPELVKQVGNCGTWDFVTDTDHYHFQDVRHFRYHLEDPWTEIVG